MKDYIYVDTDLATSYFAQINQGMIEKVLSNNTTKDESTRHDGTESTKEGGASAAGIVSGKYTKKDLEKFSQAFMKSSSETVENVLHDHLIDVLIDNINPKEGNEFEEGDFILSKGNIKTFDFKSVKNGVSESVFKSIFDIAPETIEVKEQIAVLKKKKQKTREEIIHLKNLEKQTDLSMIKNLGGFFQVLDDLFPNTILIKVGDTISLCNNDNFRFLPATLSPVNTSTREVTVLGKVVSIVQPEDRNMPSEPLELMSKANIVMPEIILNTLGIKKDGDYNVRPIAIYFE
ncbi:DUF6414 family protein [Lactococcus garvieae]|uniref:DUF6414 family protein n=1 Tax=Lactococcus garvieae TaxID=1363 RepID=UPI000EC0813A|nr:hypothetical protein [Lactococcus garvieae]MBS4464268.1 hypothetical protein [Lactococcus garvieae]HCS85336.1 hypothetical protein [Lactococcus garvieae]